MANPPSYIILEPFFLTAFHHSKVVTHRDFLKENLTFVPRLSYLRMILTVYT